jgi:hypothetical protein
MEIESKNNSLQRIGTRDQGFDVRRTTAFGRVR